MVDKDKAEERKASARGRIEAVIGHPLARTGRDYILPDERRVFFVYSTHRSDGISFWFGIPKRLVATDALVLLLDDEDLVFPYAEALLRYKDSFSSSGGPRLSPDIRKIKGNFVCRIAESLKGAAPLR